MSLTGYHLCHTVYRSFTLPARDTVEKTTHLARLTYSFRQHQRFTLADNIDTPEPVDELGESDWCMMMIR